MADVILSSAVRNNLLSLQNTASLLSKTQERLSTGLKVNSALDDPTAFFTAESLNNRASDLNRLLDSVGLAVQTIEAADNGISAITDLVETAQATARQALQSPGPASVAVSITGTGAAISADAGPSLTGTGAAISADAGPSLTGTGASISADAAASVTGAAVGTETDFVTNTTISQSDVLVINGTTLTFGTGTTEINTAAELLSQISAISGLTASYDGSDQLVITATDADTDIVVGAGSTAAVLTELGLSAGTTASTNLLSQAAVATGETLILSVGSNTSTITFGTGTSQVSTLAELSSALSGITAFTASVDASGNISLSGGGADDTIAVTGTATAATFGLSTTTAAGTNLLTQSAVATGETLILSVGSNTSTITFGTGTSQVSTLAELSSALSGITAFTASVDASGNISLSGGGADDAIAVTGTATAATFGLSTTTAAGTNLLSQSAVAQGETLTIQIGSDTSTITFGTGSTEVSTLAELSTALGTVSGGTVSVDASGNISIAASSGSDTVTIGGTSTVGNFGLTAGATAPPAPTPNAQRTALETEFNNLLTQIDQLAGDASFNGNNLLQSDSLQVIFNESGTSSLAIQGVDFDSSGLGLSSVSVGDFQTNTGVNTSLASLDTAISSLRTQASTFGSNLSVVETRQNFTNELINTLETGAAGLTLADTNEEGANMLALQTRQQLSSVALSLASQADQNVLRLF